MQPSPADIDNADIEETLALRNFVKVSKSATTISLKVIAAHHKLTLARAAKRAIIQDLLKYS